MSELDEKALDIVERLQDTSARGHFLELIIDSIAEITSLRARLAEAEREIVRVADALARETALIDGLTRTLEESAK